MAAPAARSGTETARSAAAGERIIRPEFTGSAGEYFRIWIVNLFFTLISLGIYSAWAKVRKKRYFYGSTRLDGDSFDYFASPKTILKGRIVAFVVFVSYALAAELYPSSALAFWAAFLLVLPWLVMRALTETISHPRPNSKPSRRTLERPQPLNLSIAHCSARRIPGELVRRGPSPSVISCAITITWLWFIP